MAVHLDEVQAAAAEYYTPLPHHNWEHVQQAVAMVESLLTRCWQHDISVDDTVVTVAVYFHAAGYQWDHQSMGYSSKQAYSASIATDELSDRSVSPETIDTIEDCILATRPDTTTTTVEEALTWTATLHDMLGDYKTFRQTALNRRAELQRLTGEPVPHDCWVTTIHHLITPYIEQDIQLPWATEPSSCSSTWQEIAADNLDQFHSEFGDGLGGPPAPDD